jgi:hypothetical protein
MGRKTTLLTTVGVACALAVPAGALETSTSPLGARGAGPAAKVKRQLLGSWRLVSFVVVDEQGTVIGRPYGREPAGKLTYTRAGDIWAHTGQAAPPRAARAANWYTGTFSVDVRRRVVRHRVQYSSIAAWEGTTLLRRYHFAGSGRALTLVTLPEGPAGNKVRLVLRWRKMAWR